MKFKEIIIREFTMDDYEQVTTLWTEAGIHYRPNGWENRAQLAKELHGRTGDFPGAKPVKKLWGWFWEPTTAVKAG